MASGLNTFFVYDVLGSILTSHGQSDIEIDIEMDIDMDIGHEKDMDIALLRPINLSYSIVLKLFLSLAEQMSRVIVTKCLLHL